MTVKKRGLARLSPTPRLLVFVVLSTLFTFAWSWGAVVASLVVGLVLLVLGGKYPRAALVGAFSAFLLTLLGHGLFAREGEVILSFLVFNISGGSLLKGLRLGLRIAAMILPAVAFIAVTPRHEIVEAFRGLRIPAVVDMYLTVMMRYVDILWYEIQISMKAMAMRGVNWEGGVREKIAAFRSLMLPLIFRVLDHIDGQALAIDNRGGVSTRRAETEAIDPGVAAVTMRGVSVRYDEGTDAGDPRAVRDLDLEIKQSQTTVLLGRTGAGKTTALLLCTGLIPHSVGRMRGDVEVFGFNSKEASLNQLGRLTRIVFPSAVQGLVGLTVRGELELSLRTSAWGEEQREQAMIHALELVGLDASFLLRLTLGLSGGEMQRVAIASAIVAQPLLLALDDVTVQLDPKGKREVVTALQSLLERKITTVMTDPHVSLLEEVGDRYVAFESGHLVGDESQLHVGAIEKAGLRVPQMLRLCEALELHPSSQVEEVAAQVRERLSILPPVANGSPAAQQAPLVVAKDLVYTYPNGPKAIEGWSAELYEGEFVAVLGHNGSGKTTAALLLAQAMEPSDGRITLGGEPLSRERHRGVISYVFQEPLNQMVTMKVRDELAFGPRQLGWDEERVERAVEREASRFGLSLDAIPLHLSPAEARKLAVASNLTMEPRVIILDEPTNNLDEVEMRQLIAHLKALQADGITVVVITHDIEVACEYADRTIVMHGGHILAQGPTREVMTQLDVLDQTDIIPPPVVELSLALWPDQPPALTVDELVMWLKEMPTQAQPFHDRQRTRP